MEAISVFDIFKIGVGPSSSHTMGPWRAALRFVAELRRKALFEKVDSIRIDLYGSLAKTGRGHGTGRAVQWGLMGLDPETCDVNALAALVLDTRLTQSLLLAGERRIPFDPDVDLQFKVDESLAFHPNGMSISVFINEKEVLTRVYFSIGGGFITEENPSEPEVHATLPHPIATGAELQEYCTTQGRSIAQVVSENEQVWRKPEETTARINRIVSTMKACIYRGCQTDGRLPGGLDVKRRAHGLSVSLLGREPGPDVDSWLGEIRSRSWTFRQVLNWVSCFALAVNEENAAFGRVVTAPTNGAAGVIPSVLLYYTCFCEEATEEGVDEFILTAGEIGSLFKKGATISAALGGCQAEIGVSSAMAAAALTACLGGEASHALMAAEIAMEHHLGLTCDPIGGLVQIPCIERNSMGAVKAITAAKIALMSDPADAKVSLDKVIRSMWETAQDMNVRYKETSEGGLAVQIPVNVIEC